VESAALAQPQIEIQRHDIGSSPLPAQSFDLIHARLVLIHVPVREQALQRMVTALKPGGWLVLDDFDLTLLDRSYPTTNADAAALFQKMQTAQDRLMEIRGVDLKPSAHILCSRPGVADHNGYLPPGGSLFDYILSYAVLYSRHACAIEKKRYDMTTNDFPPQLVLQQLIQGFQVTQCIYVAAKLGIADLLKDGPRTGEDLAQTTGTRAPSLYRVLRLLTATGLLTEGEAHSFALTPLGMYLRTGIPGSMHDTVLLYGDKPFWQAWGDLPHSTETGKPSFHHIFGLTLFDYNQQHPEHATFFNNMMTEWTASVAPTVASGYDFSTVQTLVDVGGGHGQMLASILQAHPTLHGVLLDLPHVVKGAPPLLEEAGVADRCQVIGGDAFKAVPVGYETYLLSRVIHDWDDDRSITLLARCHEAMNPKGKVLLVERLIETGSTPQLLVLESDVQMLVFSSGGKERTDAEYRSLLSAAGFELTRLIPVLTPFYVIEAVRV
jgi:hypothetical protein